MLFLTIPYRPIIAASIGPIFAAKFVGLVELQLWMISMKLAFPSFKGLCHGSQFLLALSTQFISGDIR